MVRAHAQDASQAPLQPGPARKLAPLPGLAGAYAAEMGSRFQSRILRGAGVVRPAEELDRYLGQADKLLNAGKHAEAQALLGGWTTVVVELLGIADDSFGSIGDEFPAGLRRVLQDPP